MKTNHIISFWTASPLPTLPAILDPPLLALLIPPSKLHGSGVSAFPCLAYPPLDLPPYCHSSVDLALRFQNQAKPFFVCSSIWPPRSIICLFLCLFYVSVFEILNSENFISSLWTYQNLSWFSAHSNRDTYNAYRQFGTYSLYSANKGTYSAYRQYSTYATPHSATTADWTCILKSTI